MEHHFNVQVAQQFGVEEAVIIHNLFHWISKNAANDENMFEGLYWTYNSIKAYSALFPYLSETKVKRVFKSLEEKGVIVKGNFSDDKWVRTNWYSFPLDTLNYLKNVGYDVHWVKMTESIGSKCTNGEVQNDQMILINNTDSKPDSKEIEELSSIEKDWRTDYSIYCNLVDEAVGTLLTDNEYKTQQEQLYINIDYKRTVIACGNYWKMDTQWESYKRKKIKTPNFISAIKKGFHINKIYKSKFGGNDVDYPRSLEDVKEDDIQPTYPFFVDWLEKNCRNILDNIRGGYPNSNIQYKRLVECTNGGTRGVAYVCLVLNRDGWDKYYDEKGFMWIYSNYIKANGLFIG